MIDKNKLKKIVKVLFSYVCNMNQAVSEQTADGLWEWHLMLRLAGKLKQVFMDSLLHDMS